MADLLRCSELKMRYPDAQEWALGGDSRGVSLEVGEGELFALIGPSGCGKTTTLRIIGGFVRASEGSVSIGGRDVTGLPAHARPTNTVFQSYALFPHKSIAENVAFGLRVSRVEASERRRRVAAALAMVGLGEYADRGVHELSGGQAQRAALARALVNRPSVLLLDEPLGALDLKLRRQMQDELVRVKQETGVSFVHVTHDQEEACAIADRIAVMSRGEIVQIASPVDLYAAPRNAYVAEFLDVGTVLRGLGTADGDVLEIEDGELRVSGPRRNGISASRGFAAVLPPHKIRLVPASEVAADGCQVFAGTVERLVFTGAVFECHVRLSSGHRLRAAVSVPEMARLDPVPQVGSAVRVAWRHEDVLFVDCDAEAQIPERSN